VTPCKQFTKMLQWHCHHRMPPDVEVEDLFNWKLESLDNTRPDWEDGGTIPGLSAQDPDPNRSPTIQPQWKQVWMCKSLIELSFTSHQTQNRSFWKRKKENKSKRWGSEWTREEKGERGCPGPTWGN